MRRPLLLISAALLVAACSSSDDSAGPDPAAPDSPGSQSPSAPAPSASAPPAASPELASWAAEFCTATTPLSDVDALAQPSEQELSDPTVVQSFAVEYYTTLGGGFTEASGALDDVAPPPVEGQEAFTTDVATAFASAGQTYEGLASDTAAIDPADTAALGEALSGLQDPLGPIAEAFEPLQANQSAELQAALTTTPECAAIGG